MHEMVKSQRNTKSGDLADQQLQIPEIIYKTTIRCFVTHNNLKNHNSIFIAQNNSCETCYILFVKNEQLQNKSNVTFPKNTKKYSVKHLLVKYKRSRRDALHQCSAYTLMQRKFYVAPCLNKIKKKGGGASRTEQGWLQSHSKRGNFSPTKQIVLCIYNRSALKSFNLVVSKAKFEQILSYRWMKNKHLLYQRHCFSMYLVSTFGRFLRFSKNGITNTSV